MHKRRLNEQSIMVSVGVKNNQQQLHLTRIYLDDHHLGKPVFMLPGALQGSELFYPSKGASKTEGLGHYLARQGYDVFIADLRGKGKSWPQISAHSTFGVHQLITEDLPALLRKVTELRPDSSQLWVGQGWGGVLLNAYYARFGNELADTSQIIHFGVRRQAFISSRKKSWLLNVLWRRVYSAIAACMGYLPLARWHLAASDESRQCLKDYLQWSDDPSWCDPVDGFDYGEAILQRGLPASLYFVTKGDSVYGDQQDVRAFIREQGSHDGRMIVLGKACGNKHNYSQRGMLLHSDCEHDHFPLLLSWLKEYQAATVTEQAE